jgi:hypothetical protein
MSDAAFDEMVGLVEQMATIADRDKGNCDVMGDEMTAFATVHTAEIMRMRAMQNMQPTPAQVQKLTAILPSLMAMDACKTNPKMKALQARFKTSS